MALNQPSLHGSTESIPVELFGTAQDAQPKWARALCQTVENAAEKGAVANLRLRKDYLKSVLFRASIDCGVPWSSELVRMVDLIRSTDRPCRPDNHRYFRGGGVVAGKRKKRRYVNGTKSTR